jgi:ABC-type antimicrobial peptide transport system permease subunit
VIGRGVRVAAGGIVLGLASALALTRVLGSLLFGIRPADPATFAAVPAMILVVAVLATWVPARRASSVDPVSALRSE